MRKIFGLTLAAAMLAGAAPAMAERWHRIASDADNEFIVYVDADAITVQGNLRFTRTYNIHATPLGGRVHASAVRSEYHCNEHYFRTLEYSYFGASNEFLFTEPSDTLNERKVPPPDSVSESTFRFVCEGEGGTPVDDPWRDGQAQLGRTAPGGK
jgi:hypothetical protein